MEWHTCRLRRILQLSPNIHQVGIAVTLFSLSTFFAGLILAYSFRIETQGSWQRFQIPNLLWLSTLLLAASSLALESARYALRRAFVRAYRLRLGMCLCLGLLFLVLQLASGLDLIGQGVAAAANPHGSAFYLFMGIHGAHFSGGIAWLAYLLVRSRKLDGSLENDLRRHRLVASTAAAYWHFMGLVWALLFFFLLRWTDS